MHPGADTTPKTKAACRGSLCVSLPMKRPGIKSEWVWVNFRGRATCSFSTWELGTADTIVDRWNTHHRFATMIAPLGTKYPSTRAILCSTMGNAEGRYVVPSKRFCDHSVDVREPLAISIAWQPVGSHNCVNLGLGELLYLCGGGKRERS